MPFYKCLIRGEKFPGYFFDRGYLVGFYTTRYVEAASPADAELAAVALLRSDPALTLPPGKPKPLDTKIIVEEITEVEARGQKGEGFTFFAEE